MLSEQITDEQWQHFEEHGYVHLGRADVEEIGGLQQRIDDIMLGNIVYPDMLMQLCPSAGDEEKARQSKEFKGSSLKYRKIQDLERDPLFRAYIQQPLFRDVTAKIIGEEVAIFRAMFFNKPAEQGVTIANKQRNADPSLGVYVGKEGDDNLWGVDISLPLKIFNTGNDRYQAALADSESRRALLESRAIAVSLALLVAGFLYLS